MTEEELKEIRERWERADDCESSGVCLYRSGSNIPDYNYISCDQSGWHLPDTPDAWAHGKEDVRRLLAEIETLQAATVRLALEVVETCKEMDRLKQTLDWVPVTEGIPENLDTVLAIVRFSGPRLSTELRLAMHHEEGWFVSSGAPLDRVPDGQRVTHWCLVPPRPKEDEIV